MKSLTEEYNRLLDPLAYDIFTAKKNLLKTDRGYQTTLRVKGLGITIKLQHHKLTKKPWFTVDLVSYGLLYSLPVPCVTKEAMCALTEQFVSYVHKHPDYYGDISEKVDITGGV